MPFGAFLIGLCCKHQLQARYLHDVDVLPRELASQARLDHFVAAACGLPHQCSLHVHRLLAFQARIPAQHFGSLSTASILS